MGNKQVRKIQRGHRIIKDVMLVEEMSNGRSIRAMSACFQAHLISAAKKNISMDTSTYNSYFLALIVSQMIHFNGRYARKLGEEGLFITVAIFVTK